MQSIRSLFCLLKRRKHVFYASIKNIAKHPKDHCFNRIVVRCVYCDMQIFETYIKCCSGAIGGGEPIQVGSLCTLPEDVTDAKQEDKTQIVPYSRPVMTYDGPPPPPREKGPYDSPLIPQIEVGAKYRVARCEVGEGIIDDQLTFVRPAEGELNGVFLHRGRERVFNLVDLWTEGFYQNNGPGCVCKNRYYKDPCLCKGKRP